MGTQWEVGDLNQTQIWRSFYWQRPVFAKRMLEICELDVICFFGLMV